MDITRRLVAVALVCCAAIIAGAAPAAAQSPEEKELKKIVYLDDPVERAAKLRDYIARNAAHKLAPAARLVLVRTLVESSAPTKEIADAAREFLRGWPAEHPDDVELRAKVAVTAVDALVSRPDGVDAAREVAETVVATTPANERNARLVSAFRLIVADIKLRQGRRGEAIATLREVVAASPDNQQALYSLGLALRDDGRRDEAIDALVRAEAVFGGDDVDGAPLRALYAAAHGSEEGLGPRIEEARAASKKRIALDGRRVEAASPKWDVKDLAGTQVALERLKGRVVVLDFWATWCPPCREELPILQKVHERYAGDGVVVLGINCEGVPDPGLWERRVRAFVGEQKLTFPVVNDLDNALNEAYDVRSLPTLVVIDKAGVVRYRNVGFEENIAEILEAQIESLR